MNAPSGRTCQRLFGKPKLIRPNRFPNPNPRTIRRASSRIDPDPTEIGNVRGGF